MLRRDGLNHISYTKKGANKKKGGDVSERTIIPTFVPSSVTNVRALDVTELSEENQKKVANLWAQYRDYLESLRKNTFSFEDFISHTTDEEIEIKWRTFKESQIIEE